MRGIPLTLFFVPMLAAQAVSAQLPRPPLPPDPLELTRQFLKLEPPKLAILRPQVRAPDVDLPIALWIATQARVAPEVVIQAHIGGLDWAGVFVKFRVPVESVIVPVESKCPPYGKAWGYRRKHGGAAAVRFSDAELAEFVHVRAINGIYGTPYAEIVSSRCAGRGVNAIIVDAHEKKHGKSKEWKEEKHEEKMERKNGHGHDGDDNPGQGHGKGKGKGKGHDGA
jgi:hypothetical protein